MYSGKSYGDFMNERFFSLVQAFGFSLSEQQLNQLLLFRDLVLETNKKMNLTAITDPDDFFVKHILDSMSIALLPGISDSGIRVIDVGTGAGFPGVVLNIVYPSWNMVLFDSLQKRVSFLNDVINDLRLADIIAVHGRAEDYGKVLAYREQFDLSVSRAVANISTLSEYCLPFVKVDGRFISYKSGGVDEELEGGKSAIEKLGGSICEILRFDLTDPGTYYQSPEQIEKTGKVADPSRLIRCFIDIKKVSSTPSQYPRKAGIPAKRPICK